MNKILLRGKYPCLCDKPNKVCYKTKSKEGFDIHCKTLDKIGNRVVNKANKILS